VPTAVSWLPRHYSTLPQLNRFIQHTTPLIASGDFARHVRHRPTTPLFLVFISTTAANLMKRSQLFNLYSALKCGFHNGFIIITTCFLSARQISRRDGLATPQRELTRKSQTVWFNVIILLMRCSLITRGYTATYSTGSSSNSPPLHC